MPIHRTAVQPMAGPLRATPRTTTPDPGSQCLNTSLQTTRTRLPARIQPRTWAYTVLIVLASVTGADACTSKHMANNARWSRARAAEDTDEPLLLVGKLQPGLQNPGVAKQAARIGDPVVLRMPC